MLDDTDRKIIAELRGDARLSISSLAARLHLARATVKARLDRLIDSGVIARFTIELASRDDLDTIRAIVLIRLEGSMSRAVIRAIAKLPECARLSSTNGVWDLVAELECGSLQAFDGVLRQIREVRGVTNSESCLLLDTVG